MRFAYLVRALCVSATLLACSTPGPDGVVLDLAPDVVASTDGTIHVDGLVIADRTPDAKQAVHVEVAYSDRDGTAHAIAPVDTTTDTRGAFTAQFSGLTWEGTGTVTATVQAGGAPVMTNGMPLAATATFAVLDRTPPAVTILPPTTDLHVGPGLPLDVDVHVTDEIGVASVTLEASGEAQFFQTTVVASGATDATVTFHLNIPDGALPGPTITLYALASDLSNNEEAAKPVVLTVDPAVVVATPAGLTGTLLTNGAQGSLVDPRAIALSPKDGKLYVGDVAQNGACNPTCIRQVDAGSGAVTVAPVYVGQGRIEGVAFDATGDHLFFTDRQNRLGRLTYSTTLPGYDPATVTFCNNVNNQLPRSPFHLVIDPTLGALVADQEQQRLLDEAACTGLDPTSASQQMQEPWGVALGPSGEIYVSDAGQGAVFQVDRTTHANTTFETANLQGPRGLEWMTGTTSAFANSLLIANHDARRLSSSTGVGTTRTAAWFRNTPVDVAVSGGTAYVVTGQSQNGNSFGRIFTITGF